MLSALRQIAFNWHEYRSNYRNSCIQLKKDLGFRQVLVQTCFSQPCKYLCRKSFPSILCSAAYLAATFHLSGHHCRGWEVVWKLVEVFSPTLSVFRQDAKILFSWISIVWIVSSLPLPTLPPTLFKSADHFVVQKCLSYELCGKKKKRCFGCIGRLS